MIKIEVDTRDFDVKVGKLLARIRNKKAIFSSVGEELLKIHKDRFKNEVTPDGEKWEKLDAKTIRNKERNAEKILVEHGNLRNLVYQSKSNSLLFGSTESYAPFHQEGTKNMSARPFLGINSKNKEDLSKFIIDLLENNFS